MSGEESLAQVNRELAHPKLKNLKRAAIIIAIYSFIFTGITSLLFCDDHSGRHPNPGLQRQPDRRTSHVHDGAADLTAGVPRIRRRCRIPDSFRGSQHRHHWFERRVQPRIGRWRLTDWFRYPHKRFGTSIASSTWSWFYSWLPSSVSRGNVYILGEAYAFGVIWSFTFNGLSMLVLRFKYKGERGWKVPPNIPIGGREIPMGLAAVFMVLLATA